MMKWISAVVLATTVTVVSTGQPDPAAASSLQSAAGTSRAADSSVANSDARPTDVSARRYHRHYLYGYRHNRYGYRPYYPRYAYYPRYYARPYYYEPDPYYVPLPFGLSFGLGRIW